MCFQYFFPRMSLPQNRYALLRDMPQSFTTEMSGASTAFMPIVW